MPGFQSQDAPPGTRVGYDPSDPVRTSPPAASKQSGVPALQENAPTLTGLDPDNADIAGGDSITLTGTFLTAVETVTFGSADAASFEVVSDTEITAVTPVGTEGDVDVRVRSAAGASDTETFSFTDGP